MSLAAPPPAPASADHFLPPWIRLSPVCDVYRKTRAFPLRTESPVRLTPFVCCSDLQTVAVIPRPKGNVVGRRVSGAIRWAASGLPQGPGVLRSLMPMTPSRVVWGAAFLS